MDRSKGIAQGLLGAAFFGAGGMKLAGGMKGEFERFGYPQWLRVAVGLAETAGAAGMLAGLRTPRWAKPSGAVLSGVMAGALWTHLVRAKDPPTHALPALALLGLSAWVASKQ